MTNPKTRFVEKLIEESGLEKVRILELACGTARYMPELLSSNTHIESYVGVEPLEASYKKAVASIGNHPKVTLVNQRGYDSILNIAPASFDIVFSVSALEHVKHLSRFVALGAHYLKPQGIMVHRYDLGHALYPGSLKERLQCFLGAQVPWIVPEDKFVRYVSLAHVERAYREVACEPYKVTYHQMPNHKAFNKCSQDVPELNGAGDALLEWEWQHASLFSLLALPMREKLFPAVSVWGRKNGGVIQ